MTNQYSDIIRALITNPNYSQEDIVSILKSYKDVNIITDEEFSNYYSKGQLKKPPLVV